MRKRAACVASALLLALGPGLLAEESLADAARKEQERRKKSHESGAKASPVVDDEALRNGSGRLANDPSEAPAAGADPPGHRVLTIPGARRSESKEPDVARDTAAFRDRLGRARERVEAAQKKFHAAEAMWFAGSGSSADPERKELRDAEAAYSAVEAEALRAGVPPSALR